MLEKNALPSLPGESRGLVATEVAAADLKTVGVSSAAFGVNEGDVITFDEECFVKSIPVRAAAGGEDPKKVPVAYWLACLRSNTKANIEPTASWIGVTNLTKRDAHGSYLDPVRETLSKFADMEQRYAFLRGKTIKCTKSEIRDFAVFKEGKLAENELKQVRVGLLEFA